MLATSAGWLRAFAVGLIVGLGPAIHAGSSASAADTWDMPTPYPEAEFHTRNIRQFADDVARLSGGELTINIHSAQSLFKHPDIKQAVRSGQVPIGEMLMANLQNEDPYFGADVLPFLATSHDEAWKLWSAQRAGVAERLLERGMRLLYAVPWPGQGFYVKKPVESVGDMGGVRFRTYNAATARLAELMGAVPTIVEVVEIPQAFATGVVDAMVTSGATGARAKAWDFVDHFYELNAWLPKNMVFVNERAFRRLDDDVQEAVLEAGRIAEKRGWDMSREETASSVSTLAQNGIAVHQPGDALRGGLRTIGQQMVQEWLETAGESGASLIGKYRASSGS
jgi:TRAP-type C4-dicarboxylate transport system substrate-binding protein